MEGETGATRSRTLSTQIAPHPAGRQPRPRRAGHGRDQLPVAVQAHGRDRLRRLDRLRIQAAEPPPRTAWAGARRWLRRRISRADRTGRAEIEQDLRDSGDIPEQSAKHRIHRPRHHGRAHGGPPARRGAPAVREHARQHAASPSSRRATICASPAEVARQARGRHRHHGAGHARTWRRCCSASRARGAWPTGLQLTRQDRGGLQLDPTDCHRGASRQRINTLGCGYVDAPVSERRGGRQGRLASPSCAAADRRRLRPGQAAAVDEDGQEHHAGGRQRRRPDHQGGQPDHRGAEHPGRWARRCCSPSKAGADPARCARR